MAYGKLITILVCRDGYPGGNANWNDAREMSSLRVIRRRGRPGPFRGRELPALRIMIVIVLPETAALTLRRPTPDPRAPPRGS
jgi:hypothetical protein